MAKFLKVLFGFVFIYMVYVIISTSKQSNLFTLMKAWDSGNVMAPWFTATLWDFYANVLAIFCWIAYKENNWMSRVLWLVLLISMGSIATMAYLLIQLFKLKEGEGIAEFIGKRR